MRMRIYGTWIILVCGCAAPRSSSPPVDRGAASFQYLRDVDLPRTSPGVTSLTRSEVNPEAMRVVVEDLNRLITTCCREATCSKISRGGGVALRLLTAPDGQVLEIEPVSGHFASSSFEECWYAKARQHRFPQSVDRED